MKKILIILLIFLFILSGCSPKEKNITFTAQVESVSSDSLIVTTSDNVSFNKAAVAITDDTQTVGEIKTGDILEITILPEIRESYPVQVTAVKIVVKGGRDTVSKAEYRKITPEEAKKMMDSEKDITILDVRTQDEYVTGHIAGSILFPSTEITDTAELFLTDKNAKILVYCRTGRRSQASAKELVKLGYTQVYDFGGINSWSYGTVK